MAHRCVQHKNNADQLCLFSQCTNRLMCLLCEHNEHETYTSIRKLTKVNYQMFKSKVNSEIDKSVNLLSKEGTTGVAQQIKMMEFYYDSVLKQISELLLLKKEQNIKLLKSNDDGDMDALIKARIKGEYADLPAPLFEKIKQVYNGRDLQTLARLQKQQSIQNAYTFMETFNHSLTKFLQNFNFQLRVNMPEIRLVQEDNNKEHNFYQADSEQAPKSKIKAKQLFMNSAQQCNYQSIITDGLSTNREIMTTSYDKTVKIFNKRLKMIRSHQFNNVCQKIESIGIEDTYAVAVSKQLQIIKLTKENQYELSPIITLRGHTQKINDLQCFNTRIIASSSNEGLKLWDLYKQKCEYTLRDNSNPSCFNFVQTDTISNSSKNKNTHSKAIAVGYHNHELKIFSLENMKLVRNYEIGGVPLCVSQERRENNLFYTGGFPKNLCLHDLRMPKQAWVHQLKDDDAVSCLCESIFDPETLFLGNRSGSIRVFDLRKQKTRLRWQSHPQTTNLSKPNGVVRIFEQASMQILSIGCNDKKLIAWRISHAE